METVRAEIKGGLKKFDGNRAYDNPQRLIETIENVEHKIAANIQLQGGCRVSDATYIKEGDLKGIVKDEKTGEEKGVIYVDKSKGGKSGNVTVDKKTYEMLQEIIKNNNGLFNVDYEKYRLAIKEAAEKSGQEYNGTHGLRWNYAQKKFIDDQNNGANYVEALSNVSTSLFHNRPSITEHYLAK
jgi:integrase